MLNESSRVHRLREDSTTMRYSADPVSQLRQNQQSKTTTDRFFCFLKLRWFFSQAFAEIIHDVCDVTLYQ